MYRTRPTPARMKETRLPRLQRGFLLVIAVVLIVVAAVVLSVMVYFSAAGGHAAARHQNSKQALFIAGTGLERGIRALDAPELTERLYCNTVTGDANLTNVAFGDGRFTVTGGASVYSNPVVTLNGAINATTAVIPLNSAYPVPGYAPSGRVMIDREKIDYSEISNDATECGTPPCLLGAQRGADGTMAADHASGTRIGQYQCALVSRGDVPDSSAPRGERVITAGIQLQEAWAVGDNGVILRWDGVNWTLFATTGTRLRAVSMDSYANGWTVGDLTGGRAQIRRWNPDGTAAWDAVVAPAVASVRLNAVHSLSHNEAWAVGNNVAGGTDSLILRWSGPPTNWAYVDPAGNTERDLDSLYMLDTDNNGVANAGWAVGQSLGNANSDWNFLQYDGAAWAPIVVTAGTRAEDLASVFCVTAGAASECWAVGDRRRDASCTGGQRLHTIFRLVAGNWVLLAPAAIPACANANGNLRAVFMLDPDADGAADDGWAVGDSGVILRWNGTAWNITVAPNALTGNDLLAVTCATPSDCWAVGQNGVIAHWNGAAWTLHPQSGVVTTNDLRGIHITAARRDPQAAWREIYQ